jgi:hypothetical protein
MLLARPGNAHPTAYPGAHQSPAALKLIVSWLSARARNDYFTPLTRVHRPAPPPSATTQHMSTCPSAYCRHLNTIAASTSSPRSPGPEP